jgi:hypothetical protein
VIEILSNVGGLGYASLAPNSFHADPHRVTRAFLDKFSRYCLVYRARAQEVDCFVKRSFLRKIKSAETLKLTSSMGGANVSLGTCADLSFSQERLKIPGACWHPDTVNPMLALRVIRANGWWEPFWQWLHTRRQSQKMAA